MPHWIHTVVESDINKNWSSIYKRENKTPLCTSLRNNDDENLPNEYILDTSRILTFLYIKKIKQKIMEVCPLWFSLHRAFPNLWTDSQGRT